METKLKIMENIRTLLSKYCNGEHSFVKDGAELIRVNFKTSSTQVERLQVEKIFIDNLGFLRIKGFTSDMLFVEITFFADSLNEDDLTKVRHALALDLDLPF